MVAGWYIYCFLERVWPTVVDWHGGGGQCASGMVGVDGCQDSGSCDNC